MRDDSKPALLHHFSAGLYAKETHIPAGMALVQHKHLFDHLSILASGTVDVEVDGQRSRITGPACLTIEAGKHHGVRAVTDAVWFCLHATDKLDHDEADAALIAPADHAQMRQMAEGLA